MWTRRQALVRGAGALVGLVAGDQVLRALAQNQPPGAQGNAALGMVNRNAQTAIDQGLAYLEANQGGNGGFGTGPHQGNVAITSLAGLALMAGGHQPGRGRYGHIVTRALQHVVNMEQNQPRGFLYNPQAPMHGPMYGHGFGTLFLAEAHGMVNNRALRDRVHAALVRAVELIIISQNPEGGWRYQPRGAFNFQNDADLSVTICQIMALRAARAAGVSVPVNVVDRCTQYVRNCQDLAGEGGFRYMRNVGSPGFARTAAGVVALYSAGIYNDVSVQKGLDYLMRHCRPGGGRPNAMNPDMQMHYYYGHYYAVQAMWVRGGRYWTDWYPAIRDELVNHPDRQVLHNGTQCCWVDRRICTHYATAMALIVLQMPNNYLPIFQR